MNESKDPQWWEALQKKLEEKFPAGIPRTKIGEATGGVFHPRTTSNWDSQGCGIEGRFKIGRLTVYPVKGVVEALKARTSVIDA
nr:hypothetical protein [uncultured Desulfobacter sp.]